MAEYATDDLRTVALSNQKSIYVGAGAPGTTYDGMMWVDISTDPPVLKVYDTTNSEWMTMFAVWYETQVGAWANPTQTPVNNGTICVLYNSTQVGTRIYVYANSAWANISTTLAATYAVMDDTDAQEQAADLDGSQGTDVAVAAGATETLLTGELVVAEDSSVCIICGGAQIYRTGSASTYRLELWFDGSMVASDEFENNEMISMTYNTTKDAATYVCRLRVSDQGSDNATVTHAGGCLYAFSVTT